MILFTDKRASALLWLSATALVAVLGYWYPMAVANRNAAPDDRFGFALLIGLPFVFAGSIAAVWNYLRLLNALTKAETKGSTILGMLGSILLLISISAAVVLALRFLK